MLYKATSSIFDDKNIEIKKENMYNNVSDEDVDELINIFVKKSQISENKDIEQYKDIRCQSKNIEIENLINNNQDKKDKKDIKMIIKVIIVFLITILMLKILVDLKYAVKRLR